jgi:hypothetical protein
MPSIINATTTAGVSVQGDNSGSLQLATNNGTTAVTIDTSQNVGIGTASPSAPLDIQSNSGGTGIRVRGRASANAGAIRYFANDNTTQRARIESNDTSLEINSISSLPITFNTADTERMRITSGGYLKASDNGTYVNSTSSEHEFYQSANDNCLRAHAANASYTADGVLTISAARNTTNNTFYALTYFNTGAGAFKFQVADSGNVTNTNGTYGTISDIKNKENIVDASPKLDKVNQLKVRNYNFIGDDLKQIGFVAQEFEQVFPSMVEEHSDKDAEGNDLGTTTKSIKTSVLIPILVKAIQELNAKVDAQAARIAELEGAK